MEGYHAGSIRENLATVSFYRLFARSLCSCSCYWVVAQCFACLASDTVLLWVQLASFPTIYGINVTTATNALAAVRAALQGASQDFGIGNSAGSTLVDADGNALVFSRSVEVSPACLVLEPAAPASCSQLLGAF